MDNFWSSLRQAFGHLGTIRVMDGEPGDDLADEWPGARFEIRIPARAMPS